MLLVVATACSAGQRTRPVLAAPTTTAPATVVTSTTTSTTVGDTVESVGRELGDIETGLRAPSTTASAAAELGVRQQVLYRLFVVHPEWVAPVVAAVPAPVRATVSTIAGAVQELAAIPVRLRDAPPPTWHIVAPAPAADLRADYAEAERQSGIDWAVLAAIHLVETRMGRIRGTSTAGARGPMQFLPATWNRYGNGGDIESDHDAILAAARLLRANGAPADLRRSLLAYNHSDHYANAVLALATVMRANPRAYDAFWGWRVIYRTTHGDVVMAEQ